MDDHDPRDGSDEAANLRATQHHARLVGLKGTDLRWQMKSEQGRRIMRRILDELGVYERNTETNARAAALFDGARNAGIDLLEALQKHCHDTINLMNTEHTYGLRHANDES